MEGGSGWGRHVNSKKITTTTTKIIIKKIINQLYFNKIKKELLMFRVCMKLLEFKFTQIL